ncbi:tRNA (adenosine(37)-N6)-dimethylallyltransferase MiaA [Costertonia aggregata]|uniref:tRNA dimethylallyltransferase n=1 Tax=Costertonia aggregata TaxID=343403 RepID=A0A7H9AJV7_9FLAO|nr:tRNA (adenosine(37)-N6)-dimethylallyltransferase MiaA [Costertonia aggregata]QLG43838.1 tRNA (adenosine(37)-N6)-dimethylallyltransferase MiaA [Costertonia aggregata]
MKKILISVVGPTAIGKTKTAIFLANYFKTVIISADSRQFYKEMRIGTAVPTKSELEAAQHHFIQHKSIHDNYSVGDFEKDALVLLDVLFKEHDVVIMVGGSGLYVNAVTKGLDAFPKVDKGIRDNLNSELRTKGIQVLQHRLKKLDSEYYNTIDEDNPHRLIRALEICMGTGLPYSSFLNKPKPSRLFQVLTVGLTAERAIVYERINQRVDAMMTQGLLQEAKSLYGQKDLNALQTVGYKELFNYIDGSWELDFAISEIKKNTRRFAKRQFTWFKKNEDTVWIDHAVEKTDILDEISSKIQELKNI